MKYRLAHILAAIALSSTAALAQLPNIDINSNGPATVRYNDPTALGKKAPDVSYADIDGTYFWKQDWYPALITMKAGAATKMKQVRLNLYTNDIHYLTNEGEMAAQTGKVKNITLYSNKPSDSATVVATFEMVKYNNKESLFQVMNDGQTQLLKRVTVILKKEGYDPVASKDKYRFDSDTDYFVRDASGIKPLKVLSKAAVFEAVPSAASAEDWLSSNKNKLKKPDEVAEFFTYLNSQGK